MPVPASGPSGIKAHLRSALNALTTLTNQREVKQSTAKWCKNLDLTLKGPPRVSQKARENVLSTGTYHSNAARSQSCHYSPIRETKIKKTDKTKWTMTTEPLHRGWWDFKMELASWIYVVS